MINKKDMINSYMINKKDMINSYMINKKDMINSYMINKKDMINSYIINKKDMINSYIINKKDSNIIRQILHSYFSIYQTFFTFSLISMLHKFHAKQIAKDTNA